MRHLRAGVLEYDASGRLRFEHPLLASAATTLIPPPARRRMHARLAELVGGEERARHLALSADGPSESVSIALHEAAEQAAERGAIGAAAELAEQALRLTPPELRVDQDKDLFPEGYGIMEVYGLNAELIDVAVYTQQALESAARIAEVLSDTRATNHYRKLAADLKEKINQRFWIEQDGTYADFHGSKSQAVSAAEGAIKQIGLKGADKLTQGDKDLIAHYKRLKAEFSAMPEGDRGWITNKNWVIATPMETAIAPPARAIPLLDKIRRENSGEYGPYLSAVERQAMMTIATGVQAVAEGNYGRTDQAMWYVDRIVQTFNRVAPGSISEMMPDYGCFAIAWTSYGIVLPLIEHVFGIHPDATNKTIVLEPHLPAGWEDISIENLPVGDNLFSFSRTRTETGVFYDIEARDSGWSFV